VLESRPRKKAAGVLQAGPEGASETVAFSCNGTQREPIGIKGKETWMAVLVATCLPREKKYSREMITLQLTVS
jgi:hypothetical protein